MNEKMKQFLDEAIKKNVFPGCCLAIIHHQKVDYYCVGKKSIYPTKEDNQMDTLYDLASLTKVVGTMPLILRMIQKGQLQYNTPIYKIIPEFLNKEITIFHLLTHTSGLPADLSWDLKATKEKIIHDICIQSTAAIPDKKVIYSDLGYIILGYVAEIMNHQKLNELVKKEVLLPLGMNQTMYCPDEKFIKNCAPTEKSIHFHCLLRGQVHDRKAYLMDGIAGHAGLFSNIFDLVQYAQMILNHGQYQNQTFLEKRYIDDLFTNFSPHGEIPRGVGFLTYTSNSLFSSLNSDKTIAHTGFTGTSLLIDMKNQVAIILLSNRVHPTRDNTLILDWRRKLHDYIMHQFI